MNNFIIIALIIVAICWVSAVAHEADMARNFNETGNAKAWFFEIKK